MMTAVNDRVDFAFRPSIAIDSGEVVVRTRDQSLLPAGVFGHCLRHAARLARLGRMQIGATEATFSLAHRFWRFASVDAVALDAQGPSIPLYAPIGPWPGSSGLDHSPAHLLSRFIGRQEEIAAMTAALAPAARGQGQMIAVVGEPGIGKSRLFHEFVRSVPQEWCVVACRGDPQLADAPYLPIARAIGACLGIAVDGPFRDTDTNDGRDRPPLRDEKRSLCPRRTSSYHGSSATRRSARGANARCPSPRLRRAAYGWVVLAAGTAAIFTRCQRTRTRHRAGNQQWGVDRARLVSHRAEPSREW